MANEKTVFILPEPKLEFLTMAESEILAAMQRRHTKKAKRVITEVSRLVDEYVANFKQYIAQNGTAPFSLEMAVKSPIEK